MIAELDPMALAMSRDKFTRFNLPDKKQISASKRALRLSISSRFHQGGCLNGSPQIRSYSELMATMGDLKLATDPQSSLRSFYQTEMLRITDIFRSRRPPALVSQQIAELRKALVTWSFRLATLESQGNLALLIGGSAANGVHSFLTDLDFVILPHSPEDREAARNVHNMMIGLLDSLGIEADANLTNVFGYRSFTELDKRYTPYTEPQERRADNFGLVGSFPAYHFLMDMQVLDVSQRDAIRPIPQSDYGSKLEALKDRLAFSVPDHIVYTSGESIRETITNRQKGGGSYVFDLKNEALRLMHFALYAARARFGIRVSDYWQVIADLEKLNVISAAESKQAANALRQLINLRHFMGFASTQTTDSAFVSDRDIKLMSQIAVKDENSMVSDIKRWRDELLAVAKIIYERSA